MVVVNLDHLDDRISEGLFILWRMISKIDLDALNRDSVLLLPWLLLLLFFLRRAVCQVSLGAWANLHADALDPLQTERHKDEG